MTVLLLLITMDVNNQVEQQYCQAMLIPIHTDSEIPEWAMIEVNGELIAPKECPDGKENPNGEESLIQRNRLELGSLRFVDEVGSVSTARTLNQNRATALFSECNLILIHNASLFLIARRNLF